MSHVRRNPVDELAEEFVERYRRGERPAVSEYTQRHPELAQEILEVFPALVMIEEAGPAEAEPFHARGAGVTADGRPLEQLGDYHIVRQIGRGGMGVVYEAVQEALGRHVALKVLPFTLNSDPTYLKRFRREARSAARLHHTNIVPVFDIGQARGIHYYAMQFIQGQGLDEVLQELRRLRGSQAPSNGSSLFTAPAQHPPSSRNQDQSFSLATGLLTGQFRSEDMKEESLEKPEGRTDFKSVPPSDIQPCSDSTSSLMGGSSEFSSQSDYHFYRSVARVGLQVAEALAYAHGQKVLHRDIKPSNLLLDLQGTIWVTDFGLAKEEESDDLTRTGDIVGTLRYMAPERFSGRADSRSDIYSLGMTLYEFVTLKPAFEEMDRARLIQRITREEPPRARKRDARIPRDLETIVSKATAKEPGDRYATAESIAEDFRRFLADRPIRARRATFWEQTLRWCRRNPAVASLIGLVAGLVLAVALVAVWDDARLRDEQRATLNQLHLTGEAEADATRRLYRSYVEQARASRLSGRLGRRVESLKVLEKAADIARDMKMPPADFLELRNETIACLAYLDLRLAKQWPGHPPSTNFVHFDGKLERYARVDRSGIVSVRRVDGDAELYRLKARSLEDFAHLSPNGQLLAIGVIGEGGRIQVFNLVGRGPVETVPETACTGFGFSPDSRWMAIGQADGSILLMDLASGQTRKKLKAAPVPIHLAFNPRFPSREQDPKGRQLAVSCANCNRVQIFDIETGESLPSTLPVTPAYWINLAWHPDGKVLAVSGDKIIHHWDVATGKQVAQLEGHKHIGVEILFNHGGDLLASAGWDALLFLWDPQTGEPLFRTQGSVRCLQFSADDSLLAATSSNNELQLWEIVRPCGYRTLIRDPLLGKGHYWGCAVSPNNRLLAVGMDDGVGLWDLPTGRPLPVLPGWTHALLFEPSGALLTNRPNGVYRFSIQEDPAQSSLLRIGTGQALSLPGDDSGISTSADGRVIANAHKWGATAWHTDRTDPPVALQHEYTYSVAVSPNGNWVATSANGARPDVKIWDANSAKPVHTLPVGATVGTVGFSPDGKWLAAMGDELRLWKVPSWEEGPTLVANRSSFAFSPDSRLLALETGFGTIELVDLSTGQECARLEDPHQDRARSMTFSPDGRHLVVNGEGQSIHVWDLPAIREQLAQRSLDWDLPPYPPAAGAHGPPLQVVSSDDFRKRGYEYVDKGDWAKAITEFTQALELEPERANSLNDLAWTLVSCPDAKLRHPDRAVALAKKAAKRLPKDGMIQNTLGVAHYRAGNWKAAIQELKKSIELRKGGDAFDWFFLAMAHWQLGEKEEAKKWHDRAVQWLKDNQQTLEKNKRYEEELGRFQQEAAELLGLKEKKD
jgi:serine/threonine protein kinase/WD40 repeat protein